MDIKIKIPDNLSSRISLSKKLDKSEKYGTCHCCGLSWEYVHGHSLMYSQSNGYFPICTKCYFDKEVTFEQIVNFYTERGIWDHESFTEEEVNYMMDSIGKQIDRGILKNKYNEFLQRKRDQLIEEIISL